MPAYQGTYSTPVQEDVTLVLTAADRSYLELRSVKLDIDGVEEFTFDLSRVVGRFDRDRIYTNMTREALTAIRDYLTETLDG